MSCTLVSSTGDKFVVDKKIAAQSILLKTMIDDDDDDDEMEIPLPNAKSGPIKKMIEFSEQYDENKFELQRPIRAAEMKKLCPEWYANFVDDMPYYDMFELLETASYMDHKPLVDLLSAKVSTLIKGKSTEDICKTFGVVEEFTEEEKKQVYLENPWLNDLH